MSDVNDYVVAQVHEVCAGLDLRIQAIIQKQKTVRALSPAAYTLSKQKEVLQAQFNAWQDIWDFAAKGAEQYRKEAQATVVGRIAMDWEEQYQQGTCEEVPIRFQIDKLHKEVLRLRT